MTKVIGLSGGRLVEVDVTSWTEQVLRTTYTNATLTGTDVVTGFAPLANSLYEVDVLLMVQSNAATTGVQVALAGPATGITAAAVRIESASTATTELTSHSALNAFQAQTSGLTTPNLLTVRALVSVGATPGVGNVRVQARSELLATVTVLPGSYMRWRVL